MTFTVAGDELRLLVERIERLLEEKQGLTDDIRDIFSEAKARGFDAKIMRECIRLRKIERHDLQERQAILKVYGEQLGLDL